MFSVTWSKISKFRTLRFRATNIQNKAFLDLWSDFKLLWKTICFNIDFRDLSISLDDMR